LILSTFKETVMDYCQQKVMRMDSDTHSTSFPSC
jgi:hypothetical protein